MMNFLGRYDSFIARMPKLAIILILLVTIFFGYFSAGLSFESSEDDFQPNTEVALADSMVREEYGGQSESVTFILISENNSISLENLLIQLELERRILSSEVVEILETSPQDPLGVSAPANLIAQGIFVSTALSEVMNYFDVAEFSQQNGELDMSQLQSAFVARMLQMDLDEMETVLTGGILEVSFFEQMPPITLEFEQYMPSDLGGYLAGTPFSEVVAFLLSNDFNANDGYASKSIVSVSVKGGYELDEYLAYEEVLEDIGEDIESSSEGLDVRILGDQLVSKAIDEASGQNIGMIMSIAFTLVIIILIFIYRSIVDTLINLVALVFAIIWVFGFGGLMGYNFNPAITTVPVLIIGLGIDYGIHYNMRYREELRKGENVRIAITLSGATVGFAIMLTTVTTLVGFLSNTSSNVPSIQVFGILCAVGIISSFIVMLTFFPAVKAVLDTRKEKAGKPLVKAKVSSDRGWGWAKPKNIIGDYKLVCASGDCSVNRGIGFGAVAARKPAIVIIILLLITAFGAYEGSKLEARFDFRDFLPEGLEVSDTTNLLFEDFNFSKETAYILVEGDVTSPDVLRDMKSAEDAAMESEYAVLSENVESPWSMIESLTSPFSFSYHPEIAIVWQTLIDTDADGEIDVGVGPEDIGAFYDTVFEFESDLASRVLHRDGASYDGAVIRVPVNSKDGLIAEEVTKDMQNATDVINSEGLDRVLVTGGPPVQYEVLKSINSSQLMSLLITFVLSLAILSGLYIYLNKSYLLGTVTLLTLVFVIVWTAGSMHLLGIPLNVVTVTIAAITVGLGIDYSIHVTQRFLEDIKHFDDVDCALCVTMNHTGSALFGSALTTVVGFGLLSLSIIPPLAQFGQVTALSITFAFLAAVFVLPTFIRLWYQYGNRISK